jgi:hypothetical protein
MGTNWYIDDGTEGDDYERCPHIGKFTFRNRGLHFIFYRSKEFQINQLFSMENNAMAVSEFGERRPVADLVNQLVDLPFTEQDYVFF